MPHLLYGAARAHPIKLVTSHLYRTPPSQVCIVGSSCKCFRGFSPRAAKGKLENWSRGFHVRYHGGGRSGVSGASLVRPGELAKGNHIPLNRLLILTTWPTTSNRFQFCANTWDFLIAQLQMCCRQSSGELCPKLAQVSAAAQMRYEDPVPVPQALGILTTALS